MPFLVHYATEYKHFGPLVHNHTLRFEAKHSFLKSRMANNKNYRNPCKSISVRHQHTQLYHHLSPNFLPGENIEFSKSKDTELSQLVNQQRIPVTQVITDKLTVPFSNSVSVNGITYIQDCCVILMYDVDYVFGKIVNTTLYNGDVYLLLEILSTEAFETHYHCYILKGKYFFRFIQVIHSP